MYQDWMENVPLEVECPCCGRKRGINGTRRSHRRIRMRKTFWKNYCNINVKSKVKITEIIKRITSRSAL